MKLLRDFADNRFRDGCVFCGGPEETRDHAPSRVLLDAPFPEHLPKVPSCFPCNNGFSLDEQYVACLIDCIISGSTDPDVVRRDVVRKTLRSRPALRARIESARRDDDGKISFVPENERIRNVIQKLATTHVAYELCLPLSSQPSRVAFVPFPLLNEDRRAAFDAEHSSEMFPEVGSRALQRVIEHNPGPPFGSERIVMQDWVDVQEGRYRYLAFDDHGTVTVRIVLSEYLACEVVWNEED